MFHDDRDLDRILIIFFNNLYFMIFYSILFLIENDKFRLNNSWLHNGSFQIEGSRINKIKQYLLSY